MTVLFVSTGIAATFGVGILIGELIWRSKWYQGGRK